MDSFLLNYITHKKKKKSIEKKAKKNNSIVQTESSNQLEFELRRLNEEYVKELKRGEEFKKFKDQRLKKYIKEEQEFRKIIEKLNKKLKPDDRNSGADDKIRLEEIRKAHQKILGKISTIQMRTAKVLLDQEKDIIHFYNQKINSLTQQFKEENLRQQQRHADFRKKEENLLSELEWIKGIAHKIDKENFYLVKRHMELKVEFETQNNDRNMLMR